MNNLQSRGTLRVSKKSRKVKKKKLPEQTLSGNKPIEDHSGIQKETEISIANQVAENRLLPKEYQLKASSTMDEDIVVHDYNDVQEDRNSQGRTEPMENKISKHANEDMLDGTVDVMASKQKRN
ncbi:hypothetical protein RIF29_20862 [Crotalaria pallida]|uniref:Uncharacterized protein n=1 Tax=Crotalaria pallida TaxID=3830 RepID=A0AAN9F5H5_CROPI